MRWLVPLILTVLSTTTAYAEPASARPHLYSVVFEATTDENGKVITLVASKVIDPATGSTEPVNIDVPETYVVAAREWLGHRTYKPRDHFFTWTYFDPQRPEAANIDPDEGRP